MGKLSYDPVTAIDEAAATGETARVFADIRDTMNIPLVTSIWRGLDGIENSLPNVWAVTKPLFRGGWPEHCLQQVVGEARLPPLAQTDIHWGNAAGGSNAIAQALVVLDAYNRSNGLNLVALSALFAHPTGDSCEPLNNDLLHWPVLPRLLARDQIGDTTWNLVRRVNAFGSSSPDGHVATLWRHLAHWPGLLTAVDEALTPLQCNGAITAAAGRVVQLAQREAQTLANWRTTPVEIPLQAEQTIRNYVDSPDRVARMVTIGHMLARAVRAAA